MLTRVRQDEYGYPIEKSVDGDYTPRTLSPLPEEEEEYPHPTHRRQHSYGVGSEYTSRDRQGHARDASGGSLVSHLTGDQTGEVQEAQVLQLPARPAVLSSSPRAQVVRRGPGEDADVPAPAYPSGVMSGYYLPRDDEELVPPPRGKSLPTRNAPIDVPVVYPVALPRQIFPPAQLKPQPRGASLANNAPTKPRTSLPYETPSPSLAGSDSPSVGVALGTPSLDSHALAPTPGVTTPLEDGAYFGHRISQGGHPSMTPLYGPTVLRTHSVSSQWTSSSDDAHPTDMDVVDIDMSAYGYDSTPGTSLHSDSVRNSKAIDTPTIAETLSAIPSPLAPPTGAAYPFPVVAPYAPGQKNLPATPRPLSFRKSFDAGRRPAPTRFEEVRLDDGSSDEDSDDIGRLQRQVRRGSLKPQPIELDDDLDVIAFPHTPSNFSYAGTPMPLRTPMSISSSRGGGGAYPFPPVMAVSPLPTPGGMAEVGMGRPGAKRTSTTTRRISAAAVALEQHDRVDTGRRIRSAGLTF